MKTSLNHQLHRTQMQSFSNKLSNIEAGNSMEKQQVGAIGRQVRTEQTWFRQQCLERLSETGNFLHQLRDFTVEPKPGVSHTDDDLFATLNVTSNIAESVNQRWESSSNSSTSFSRPITSIKPIKEQKFVVSNLL